MFYRDFIKTNEGFQYSINLQYDLNKLDKISGYIPTSSSVNILRSYVSNIYTDSKERANILIGPYGKGKSHLLLILMALISSYKSEDEINKMIEKIGKIDEKLKKLIFEIRKDNKKILPVIISGNTYDLNQSFLIGIKDALEREGLDSLRPNTYFDVILETMKMWEDKYKDTYKLFINKLKEQGIQSKEFINDVNNYDEKAYDVFKNIYPQITSGTEFNPLFNSDIVRLYEELNIKLCETNGYKGMFIVFDEFSKFMEASIARNTARDIKLIQDLAELANRSGENQIHFTCITHKGINDYITNLPKEKIDAWRAVEGRFREIYYTSSSSQNYELISNTIIKDNKIYEEIKFDNREVIESISADLERTLLFSDVENFNAIIKDGCFPLHPISSYALPRVSELVAQNERTLFTFLSKDEKGSLVNFIKVNNGEFQFLTIDWIYDYFEILFKKEVFNEKIHSLWLKAHNAKKKSKSRNEKKIVKALAVIFIIDEFEKLAPNDLFVKLSLGLNEEEYLTAINNLLHNQIISKNKSDGYYRFSLGSEFNVKQKIAEKKNLLSINVNIKNEVEKIIDLGYEIPKKYNDELEMIRFFKKAFITANELANIKDANEFIKYYKSDGIILYLICLEDDDRKIALKKIKELNNKRIVLCIPDENFIKEDDIREYLAIQMLKNDSEFLSQEIAMKELELFEDDLVQDIEENIAETYSVRNKKCKIYDDNGRELGIKSEYYLNRKISEICMDVFDKTIVFNNELINKATITPPILKARNKVIQHIFDSKENVDKFISETKGPEVTIFKVAIENKGLLASRTGNERRLESVLNEIEKFILKAEENKLCFIDLYNTLYDAKYGYGLRAGIIPIYLAFIIKEHIKNIIIYYMGKEVPLSVDSLNKINENPDKYYLLLEKGSNEKYEFISALENLFEEYRATKISGYSRYNSLVEGMQNWIFSLPKFARECECAHFKGDIKVDKEVIDFRKELLRFDVNPRELLFERIPDKVFKTATLEECYEKIEKTKLVLDKFVPTVKNDLAHKTKNIFEKGYRGELGPALENWYDELPDSNKSYLYDSTSNRLLKFISMLTTSSEDVIIEKLARLVTGLNIEDWNDKLVNSFLEEIANIEKEISAFIVETASEDESSFEISLVSKDIKQTKTFDSCSISSLGDTMFNNIEQIFDEYGEAIDDNEKRNIIMKILQKYM